MANKELKIYALGEAGLETLMNALQGGDGGPPTSDGLDVRLATVEAHIQHIQSDVTEIKGDVRKLLYAIIGAFLILASLAIGIYVLLHDDISSLGNKIDGAVISMLQEPKTNQQND